MIEDKYPKSKLFKILEKLNLSKKNYHAAWEIKKRVEDMMTMIAKEQLIGDPPGGEQRYKGLMEQLDEYAKEAKGL